MTNSQNSKHFFKDEIPKDWEIKRLGDICQIKGRIGYRGYTVDDIVPKGKGAITLSPSNFKNGYLDYSESTYISWFKYNESPEIQIENGDILLVKTGSTFGKSVLVDKLIEKATINPQIVVIKNVTIDVKFLSYIISDNIIQKQIKSVVVGGAIPTLSQENILNFTFPHPTLPEQKRIANILSLMDKAIKTNNNLIIQKELSQKWLLQQLLTGKKRLRGFKEEWKENKLAFFIKEHKQKPTELDSFEVLTSSKSGLIRQTDYYGDNRITNREDADYNVIPPNYLTYRSRSDDGLFTFNKNDLGFTGLISGYYPVFTIKNGDVNFILKYMNYYKHKLTKYAIGTSQLVLAINALKEATFLLPSEVEQTAISHVLQSADREIQLLKLKTEKLKEQKKGLMQVLLTGKKRLQN